LTHAQWMLEYTITNTKERTMKLTNASCVAPKNVSISFTYNGKARSGKVVEYGTSKEGSLFIKVDCDGIVKTFTSSKMEDFKIG